MAGKKSIEIFYKSASIIYSNSVTCQIPEQILKTLEIEHLVIEQQDINQKEISLSIVPDFIKEITIEDNTKTICKIIDIPHTIESMNLLGNIYSNMPICLPIGLKRLSFESIEITKANLKILLDILSNLPPSLKELRVLSIYDKAEPEDFINLHLANVESLECICNNECEKYNIYAPKLKKIIIFDSVLMICSNKKYSQQIIFNFDDNTNSVLICLKDYTSYVKKCYIIRPNCDNQIIITDSSISGEIIESHMMS